MIRPLRRLHRMAIPALMAFVVPIMVLALTRRTEVPVVTDLVQRAELEESSFQPGPWILPKVGADQSLRLRIGAEGRLIELEARSPSKVPDLLVYASPDPPETGVSSTSRILGRFTGTGSERFDLGASPSRTLLLLSLAHDEEIVAGFDLLLESR